MTTLLAPAKSPSAPAWRRLLALLGLGWGLLEAGLVMVESLQGTVDVGIPLMLLALIGVSLGVPCALLLSPRRGVIDLARLAVAVLMTLLLQRAYFQLVWLQAVLRRHQPVPAPAGFWASLDVTDVALLIRLVLALALMGTALASWVSTFRARRLVAS